nr:MAG TPA: Integrin beta-4, Dystonin, PLAKIN, HEMIDESMOSOME, STRUCTURAL PROTEIN [Caudoviricetes sp.]
MKGVATMRVAPNHALRGISICQLANSCIDFEQEGL